MLLLGMDTSHNSKSSRKGTDKLVQRGQDFGKG
jgi:hypothetical protein